MSRSQPRWCKGRLIRWPDGPAACTRLLPTKLRLKPMWVLTRRWRERLHLLPHVPQSSRPARLLRPATPPAQGDDAMTQDCMTCHNGGTYLSPAAPNIMAEFSQDRTSASGGQQPSRCVRAGRAEKQSPRHVRGLPQRPCVQSGDNVRRRPPCALRSRESRELARLME